MTPTEARELADGLIGLVEKSVSAFFKKADVRGRNALEQRLIDKVRVDAEQWNLEDEIRKPALPVRRFVAVKRTIDAHNLKRHEYNEAIDDLLWRRFGMSRVPQKAEIVSETPGMMLDRMSILAIRRFHLNVRLSSETDPKRKKVLRHNLRVADAQHRDLSDIIRSAFVGFARSTRRFARYRQLKMYGR
jgi:hypothetical protein